MRPALFYLIACVVAAAVGASGSAKAAARSAPAARTAASWAVLAPCYWLGFDTYKPQAAVIAFDEGVQADKPDTAAMAELARRARHTESSGYLAALDILRTMSAPSLVEAPYARAAAALASPVRIDAAAKARFAGDPAAQQVWSMLDEADRIAPDESQQLDPWLSLSRGPAGLWAFRLGCLSAVVHAGIPGDPAKWPLIQSAAALAADAPSGTPPSLVQALRSLSADFKPASIRQAELIDLQGALQAAFGASPAAPAHE